MMNKKEIIKTIVGLGTTLLLVSLYANPAVAAVGGIVVYIGLDRIWKEPE